MDSKADVPFHAGNLLPLNGAERESTFAAPVDVVTKDVNAADNYVNSPVNASADRDHLSSPTPRAGSFFLQVYATIRRQITQKRRTPFSLLIEVTLPVLFAILLAYVSTLADFIEVPEKQYVNELFGPSNLTELIRASVCYYPYNNPDPKLEKLFKRCWGGPYTERIQCNFPYNDDYTTQIPYGICGVNLHIVAPFLRNTMSTFADDLQLLDFDTYIMLQWIMRIYYGVGSSIVFLGDERLASMRVAGKVHFAQRDSSFVRQMIRDLSAEYTLFPYVLGELVDTRDDILPHVTSIDGEGKTWAIVETDYKSPTDVSFVISINRTAVPQTNHVRSWFTQGLGKHPYASYYCSGFLTLQHTLSNYFVHTLNRSHPIRPPVNEPISIAPMGHPAYVENTFFTVAGRTSPLVQVLSFLYTVSQLSKRLVEEKEQRLREGTMIMGLTRAAFFSSWMLVYYVQVFITATLSSIVLSGWLLTKTVFPITFMLYFLFSITVVNTAALLSTFFNKSRIAALVVPLLYFMMSIPSFALPPDTDAFVYVLLSWLPTMPFSMGNTLLFNYQLTTGLSLEGVVSPNDVRPYNMATCYVFLLFNIALCPVLMLYLDAVLPKEWGSRKHPLFCCLWWPCCGKKKEAEGGSLLRAEDVEEAFLVAAKDDGDDSNEAPHVTGSPRPHMKLRPSAVDVYPGPNSETTIHIRRVRKEFDTPSGEVKVAVNDVDLRMFPDMITVLLGHNGAGKTTLMNMMTGMLDMTSGDVVVYGVSVHDDLDAVRRNVGYCPQHNILWDDLTCVEHLRYFARLKGVAPKDVEPEALRLLERVDLLDKKDVFSKQLSGGQKRKLSVAIAFIGGSQLILLDEPTAGMDVTARRHTWEIIREMSVGRTILLTTHFMDEADLLGTRIAIMSQGRLHSYGSPMYLKNQLGSGYVLRVSVVGNVSEAGAEAILAEARSIIPDTPQEEADPASPTSHNVTIREVKGQEVALLLHKKNAALFPAILRHFESDAVKARHSVSGVSMTVSTLEDVFLKIAEEEEEEVTMPKAKSNAEATPAKASGDPERERLLTGSSVNVEDDQANAGTSGGGGGGAHADVKKAFASLDKMFASRSDNGGGWFRQLGGLLLKRFHYARRDNRTLFFQIAMPLLCLVLAMVLAYLDFPTMPRLMMDNTMFEDSAKLTTAVNNGTGRYYGDYHDSYGYDRVDMHSFPSTYAFSKHLLATYSSNGNRERITAVSRRATNFNTFYNISKQYTTIFTNASAPHSAPQGLHEYYTTLAREVRCGPSGEKACPYGLTPNIEVGSWPLPFTERQNGQFDAVKQLFVALFVLIPFTFVPSTYVSYIVKERACKATHLQFVSGVSYSVYWVSNFLFDLLAFAFTASCAMGIFYAFGRDEFVGDHKIALVTAGTLMLYGVSGIFAAYSISFLFTSHSAAQNTVMIVNFVIGFCLVIASSIMKRLLSTKDTMEWLIFVFRCFPAFCLGESIMNIAVTTSLNRILKRNESLLKLDLTGYNLIYMAGASFVFMVITLIVDHPKRKEKQRMVGFNAGELAPLPPAGEEDEDVVEERRVINEGARDGDVIVVKGLRKVYSLGIGKEKVAVQNITFGVKQGEVFGFLGTNGAGKTSTMGVLTGEFVPTNGEATVVGFDVVREAKEAFKVIGYCPQFDALLDLLTPAEHLNLYASLRGVPREITAEVVDGLITACGLAEFRNIPAMRLSGGNKRKLSVAISLMGGPKLVFLDEPSAGMDPHARRGLWDVIVYIGKHSSVLLTTHHLEEVDVLAHRVGIMDKGLMKCIGSLEHLKRKFGDGFELTVRVGEERRAHEGGENANAFLSLQEEQQLAVEATVTSFIHRKFPASSLVESREGRLVFALPASSTSLADLFEEIQRAQEDPAMAIRDYIVQQTSLENVFMKITAEAEAEAVAEREASCDGSGKEEGEGDTTEAIWTRSAATEGNKYKGDGAYSEDARSLSVLSNKEPKSPPHYSP